MKVRYSSRSKGFARKLRKEGTIGEAMLWLQLKSKQRRGLDFHRQKPFGSFILDFWCPRLALAIEIDGVTHDVKMDKDRMRQQELEKQGVRFLRFTEKEVQTNLDGVVQAIDHWIDLHAKTSEPDS